MVSGLSGPDLLYWLSPLVAFAVSFATSMGGVSGAFLLLPYQISVLGITSPSVSATNQLFNVLATPGGVYRYWKESRMVWPLALCLALGTLPGVVLGAFIRLEYLPDPTRFKLFAAGILALLGVRMVWKLRGRAGGTAQHTFPIEEMHTADGHIRFRLGTQHYTCSRPGIIALSVVVGMAGGIYGIGGGAIIAPFLVSMCGLPVHAVAGASLFGTLITSVVGVVTYQLMAPLYPHLVVTPDWTLGLLLGMGGLAGTYLGARCQRHVPAHIITWILAGVVLFTAGKYALDFLL